MSTMAIGSLYPTTARMSGQESVNAGGTAKVPTRHEFEIPVLPGVAGYFGIGLPALIALGVLGWFLIERYD